MSDPIKILIIDDSRSVQKMLYYIFSRSASLRIVGAAYDAYEAVDIMRKVKPDVIILDVQMPKMDGLTFLKKLMDQHPIPVIVFSSLITQNPKIGMRALEYGAVEVVDKPVIDFANLSASVEDEKLVGLVRAIGQTRGPGHQILFDRHGGRVTPLPMEVETTVDRVVAIGASAGGTQAIKHLLMQLPTNFPPVVVVQHMPVEFTGPFASYLNEVCAVNVYEAQGGERLLPGTVYVAPGDRHLTVHEHQGAYRVRLKSGEAVSGHKPSVDVLFRSMAEQVGAKGIGVILTGMGRDGASGLLALKEANGMTIAQDEQSCVVFGMPKEAIKLNAVDQVCALDQIPSVLNQWVIKKKG
ncbi:chemotaxis response regulator protein-glutamate methylesterase [Reichenbachiella sp. 5M10]|uniref:protein-glutamate methylesterase/protein-glutamine glutaminase n=1 Tax=Reichenbachiella sp. 5M10 TaxID=1889772 RepID=UPI000C15B978|nr:chemotaxis response regulator protein-glutamate methylesterase [Reichenbachiella sp. 5M10]